MKLIRKTGQALKLSEPTQCVRKPRENFSPPWYASSKNRGVWSPIKKQGRGIENEYSPRTCTQIFSPRAKRNRENYWELVEPYLFVPLFILFDSWAMKRDKKWDEGERRPAGSWLWVAHHRLEGEELMKERDLRIPCKWRAWIIHSNKIIQPALSSDRAKTTLNRISWTLDHRLPWIRTTCPFLLPLFANICLILSDSIVKSAAERWLDWFSADYSGRLKRTIMSDTFNRDTIL